MSEEKPLYPRAYSHTALTVSDVEKAAEFYQKSFGFYRFNGPHEYIVDETTKELLEDIFDKKMQKMILIQLTTSNGIGIELYQFLEPETPNEKTQQNIYQNCIQNIAFLDPDIEDAVKRVVENGGKLKSNIITIIPDSPYQMCQVEDPWGNIIEIYTHNYDEIWSIYN